MQNAIYMYKAPNISKQNSLCATEKRMHNRPPLQPLIETIPLPVTRISSGTGHSFFGYYDKSCWDASGRWIRRALRVHRSPHRPTTACKSA